MKKLILVLLALLSLSAFSADLDDCSKATRNKFAKAYSCVYAAPSGCDLTISEKGKEAGMQVFTMLSEANSEYTCKELDAAATFILATIQKL